ncbi:MAG TPA: DUF6152 family protein [Candidatus Acidoferrales bacterium]|jgi:hypothetical protein|nr:DUF6152 family protein [Candidatus Acidoferrales bacterium]
MQNRTGALSVVVLFIVAASLPVLAHHGNASYDTEKTVTVKGTVSEYIWANPHVFLKVDAKDGTGNTQHWVIEAQNLVQQATLGWTNDMFKPGDQVVIDVTPSKNGRPIGRFKGRIIINGQEFKPSR